MKNTVKIFAILLSLTQVLAKDTVVLKNGESFECWVTEYKEGHICYVTKPDGITQEIPLDLIKHINLKGFFEITGTRTYDTSTGTNTVFVLQQIE
jgi:hypothetical protein